MQNISFFYRLTTYAWKRICQQFWLLAVLFMLIFILPLGVGPVADALLSQGVGFSGITLAVTTPQDGNTGALLEQLTGSMRDIRQYCQLESMESQQARQALAQGEVTAILELPEDFIGGVLEGDNPDLTLVVRGDRPLESLLTLWVGQSAADMLTAAQRGIYSVLDLYPGEEQVVYDINFAYIQKTLGRAEMFRTRQLQATDSIPVREHYALSLLIFLALSLSPLLLPVYDGQSLAFRRRLYALGHGAAVQYGSTLMVCFGVFLLLTLVPGLLLSGGNWAGALVLTLFCTVWAGVCCLAARTAGGCGGISVLSALGMTFLAGGVIPPALLPETLRRISRLLPAEMLRSVLYLQPGDWATAPVGLALWIAGLGILGLWLYRRRLLQEAAK